MDTGFVQIKKINMVDVDTNNFFVASSMIGYWHNPVVCPSICLWRCVLWLSGSMYKAKSCTSVFLASTFVRSDTFWGV